MDHKPFLGSLNQLAALLGVHQNDRGAMLVVQGLVVIADTPEIAQRKIGNPGQLFVLTLVAGGAQIQIVFQIAAHVIVLISVLVINAAVLKGQFGAEAIPTKILVFEVVYEFLSLVFFL